MELVKILGVDASLRNTGLAVVEYNNELSPLDPNAFKISHCQTLVNPKKYKGVEAILNMLDMISTEAKKNCYKNMDATIVESPPIMFNKNFSSSIVSSIAHVSGGAAVIFGLETSHLFQPNHWNKNRKKEVTHAQTINFFGDVDNWGYEKRIKSEALMEHILDAASMAYWWIKSNYLED